MQKLRREGQIKTEVSTRRGQLRIRWQPRTALSAALVLLVDPVHIPGTSAKRRRVLVFCSSQQSRYGVFIRTGELGFRIAGQST